MEENVFVVFSPVSNISKKNPKPNTPKENQITFLFGLLSTSILGTDILFFF